MKAVNIPEMFETIEDLWSPRIVGEVNDQYVKLARLKGSLAWHKHDDEDELFLVARGRLVIELEGREAVAIGAGEFFVVPKGVMHNPVADEECWVMLVETKSTRHMGDLVNERTRSIEEQMAPAR